MIVESPHVAGLLLGFGVFCIGLLSPGPNIMAIIGTSMSAGRAPGIALALGISVGSGLWGLLTWTGLTTILTLYASVLTAIKLAGAAYLLWLAARALQSAWAPVAPFSSSTLAGKPMGRGFRHLFQRGLLIQMTNPKAALTWIAGMSLAVDAEAPFWVGATLIAGTLVMTTTGHLVYALAFSTMPMVAAYRRARRWIEAGLGVFFCFASYKLLTTRT